MGHGTNSKIRRTVTDEPFLHANMSKCTSDNEKKIHTGPKVIAVPNMGSLCCLVSHKKLRRSCPSGIFLPGAELLQSPFRTEFSMGSRSRRYRRSLRRHRRFLRNYRRFLRSYRRSLRVVAIPEAIGGRRCGDADRCTTR